MKTRVVMALLLLVIPVSVLARGRAGAETLLRRLYASHQPWAHKDALTNESLPNFFDPELIRLIRADRDCKAPDWGVGNLDFDPILNAQDFGDNGIGDLQIRQLPDDKASRYEVSFLLFPGVSDERTTLVYRLTQSAGQWRIADIEYEKSTLLKILAPPCK